MTTTPEIEGLVFADNPYEAPRAVRRLTIVVDNPRSWFVPYAQKLRNELSKFGEASIVGNAAAIPDNNEIAFLLSCENIVPAKILARSKHNIVVHASDLPRGKGMSPMTWQVLEGAKEIPIRLFEAVEKLDAGPIYMGWDMPLTGKELRAELDVRLGEAIVQLCQSFMLYYPGICERGTPQTGEESRYRRRNPEDSKLDPNKTIAEQFNLLRVVDNERYPAFFEHLGRKYVLRITAEELEDL